MSKVSIGRINPTNNRNVHCASESYHEMMSSKKKDNILREAFQYSQSCAASIVDEGHEIPVPSNHRKQSTNESDSLASILNQNEYLSNESEKYVINEIKLIPRNKINAFKAFRNTTFKLVPTGNSHQTLLTNSNNSNRFVTSKSKGACNGASSNINSNDAYINKINKSIMLKKITELANPYHSEHPMMIKPFKRIIPHPIIDDRPHSGLFIESLPIRNQHPRQHHTILKEHTENSTRVFDKDNKYPQKDQSKLETNKENMKRNFDEEDLLTLENNKLHLQFSVKEPVTMEMYENILERKLKEIRDLKNKQKIRNNSDKNLNLADNQSVFVYCSNHSSDTGNEVIHSRTTTDTDGKERHNKSRQRTTSCGGYYFDNESRISNLSTENVQLVPVDKNCSSKERNSFVGKTNVILDNRENSNKYKRENTSNSGLQETRNSNMNNNPKATVNEIEVCIDDHIMERNSPVSNCHIPLYFRCIDGKKLKFKLKYLSKLSQAQKVFCSRMSNESISNLRFSTEYGRIIGSNDTPHSLQLEPHDIIVVSKLDF